MLHLSVETLGHALFEDGCDHLLPRLAFLHDLASCAATAGDAVCVLFCYLLTANVVQMNECQKHPSRMHNSHLPQHIWYTQCRGVIFNPTTKVLKAFQKQEEGMCILS